MAGPNAASDASFLMQVSTHLGNVDMDAGFVGLPPPRAKGGNARKGFGNRMRSEDGVTRKLRLGLKKVMLF